jgi:signal transduction histidine kinase
MANEELDPSILGQLLALLAHDLRNPLSALHSNVAFVGSVLDNPDEDVADALADGLVSCEGLTHIIDNIDLLGQCLRKSSFPPRAALGALSLVEDVLRRCQRLAASHGVDLSFQVESLSPLVEIFGIRDLLVRALSNLIHNCVQNSPPRGVVIARVLVENGHASILLFDQCPRLPEATWREVFTPQGQIAAKSSSGRYSRGLGLYAAGLAAVATGASVQMVAAPEGFVNGLELRVPLAG